MITLRKLQSLSPDTRRRKILRILEALERDRETPDLGYLQGLVLMLAEDRDLPDELRGWARDMSARTTDAVDITGGPFRRELNQIRHALKSALGVSSGDWDLLPPAGYGGTALPERIARDAQSGSSGGPIPISVYCDSIRAPFNLGSIARTAVALGVVRIGVSPESPDLDHPRVLRSAMGAMDHVTMVRDEFPGFASDQPVVVLETGGTAIESCTFPPGGVLVVGSEELGVRPEILKVADRVVSIPLVGPKGSLNVGVALGIALHRWVEQLSAGVTR